jgi:hypothetical protein
MNEEKITTILRIIESIDQRLTFIEKQIIDIKRDAKIMSGHVCFVEALWKRVKDPFLYLTTRVESWGGLAIKNKND